MITAFKIWLLTWLWLNYDPIKKYQEKLYNILDNKFNKKLAIVNNILFCHKCLSFTLILLITFNIYLAIIFAILTLILEKLI